MKIITTIPAVLALALLAGCAPKTDSKSGEATTAPTGADAARADSGKLVTQLMAPTFNADQQGRILNMGYFMAASALCPDLEVDAAKLGRAVEETLALDAASATDAQKEHQRDAILMFMGMSSGAIIGSHMDSKDKFCANAKKAKDEGGDGHLFVEGAPSAPSTAPVPAESAPAPKS